MLHYIKFVYKMIDSLYENLVKKISPWIVGALIRETGLKLKERIFFSYFIIIFVVVGCFCCGRLLDVFVVVVFNIASSSPSLLLLLFFIVSVDVNVVVFVVVAFVVVRARACTCLNAYAAGHVLGLTS